MDATDVTEQTRGAEQGMDMGIFALVSLPFFAVFVVLSSVFLRPTWAEEWLWWPTVVGAVSWVLAMALCVLNGGIRASSVVRQVAWFVLLTTLVVLGAFFWSFVGWDRVKSMPVWVLTGPVIGAAIGMVCIQARIAK